MNCDEVSPGSVYADGLERVYIFISRFTVSIDRKDDVTDRLYGLGGVYFVIRSGHFDGA